MSEWNEEVCLLRHEQIEKEMAEMKAKLDKMFYTLLAILTTALGILGTLLSNKL